jgi:hypothetical protein
MSTDIKCPNCGKSFDVENVISAELDVKYQKEYQQRLQESLKGVEHDKKKLVEEQRSFEEKKKKENELFLQKVAQERKKMETEVQEQLRKSISADYENRLRMMEQNNRDNEEKLKLSRQKELEFLQKEQQLKNKEAELEITVQKRLHKDREKLAEELRKLEEQRTASRETEHLMQVEELRKQLDDQKKLAEEMKRRAEQGSTQLQGEIQELVLEGMLKETFPFDIIEEVGKGIRGADCIQTVRDFGQQCGKIVYESKRTINFSQEWIEKLKADARSLGADVAVIVTQAMPKGMDCFGEKDGVWICNFSEVKALASILRDFIIKVYHSAKSDENKGEKMQMLYKYLTSNEFSSQWKAMREGFMGMKNLLQKERDAMEKIWKAREKQLEKILLNAAHVKGSIEGIAGMESIDLNLLEEGENDALPE